VIAPLIPIPAWLSGRGGRPEGYGHREMIDAVLYLVPLAELNWVFLQVEGDIAAPARCPGA